MGSDALGAEAVARDVVERAIVCVRVDSPEPGVAEIGHSWAELESEEPEESEDDVADPGRVGHDLGRLQACLLLEEAFEDEHRVA